MSDKEIIQRERAKERGTQACLLAAVDCARVVKGSLPRWGRKEPSPGFPNAIFRPSLPTATKPGWERIGDGDGHFTLVKSLA